jgi:hypothetical protein
VTKSVSIPLSLGYTEFRRGARIDDENRVRHNWFDMTRGKLRTTDGKKMIMNAAIRTLLSLLLLNSIAALSVSRFDERDIRNENDFNDSPPPNLRMGPVFASSDVEEGVSFTRNINLFPADAAFVMSLANDDCKQHDVFGDNDCHFSWGQNVTGKFNVKFGDQIEEGDYIVGDFKVTNWSP